MSSRPSTPRFRTRTTDSSPTFSAADCTRSSRGPRRRDHAGKIDRAGRGRPQVWPVHQDHRRTTHRLFGAAVHLLPDIWADLVAAGFESGHAYGKAVRTVKSCVGSTWCRYGVQDSVGFAIRVEMRYRGIRAPHKLKAAVSGCIRECAEAQSKDFGLIATEKGWNLYVCGNGGAHPRHADLLAADLDEETATQVRRSVPHVLHPDGRPAYPHVGLA